jgi:hypothetical protein
MAEKILLKLIRHSWIAIALIIILTIFFVSQFKHLYYQNKMTSWLPQDDPVVKLLVETGEKFGSTEMVLITLKARQGETFRQDILKGLKEVTEELRTNKEIFYVTSIISAPDIQKTEEGLSVSDFLEEIPESEEELGRKKAEALKKEAYLNTFISPDGAWLGAGVYLREGVDSGVAFGQVIRAAFEKYLGDKVEFHYAGEPSFTYFADKYLKRDLTVLVPVIILTILLVLYFSFRKLRAVFLPSLVVWLSTAWVFGLMAVFRVPMNLVTPALPVLLVGLGSAYGIHMVNSLEQNKTGSHRKAEWIVAGTTRVALPVFMAAVTTMVGFASFITARLGLISNFGIFAGVGVILAMILAFTLIPASFYLLPERKEVRVDKTISLVNPGIFHWLSNQVIRRSKAIILGGLLIFVFMIFWIPGIRREVNFISYFPPRSEPRLAEKVVKENFDGAAPLNIYFRTENLRSAGTLRILRRAENFMASLPECGLPLSVAELVEELNEKMNDCFTLPETDGQVANLWFFIEGRDELKQLITDDFTEGLVFSRTSSSRTEFHWQLRRAIQAFLTKEMRAPFRQIRLEGLSAEVITQLREREMVYLLDEVGWLLQRYAPGSDFDRKEAENALTEVIENWPRVDRSEVLSIWQKEIEIYILSPAFDFELPGKNRQELIRKLLIQMKSRNADGSSWLEILRSCVPARSYDEELAERVVSTLLLRLKEAQEKVVVEQAYRRVKALIPEKARNNHNFERRLTGLLFELADGLLVLPETLVKDLPGDSLSQNESITFSLIDQSGLPPALTQLDHFLFVSQIQSFALALVLTFFIMLLLRKSLVLGLVSITPIVFTLGVVYGFFGLGGIELDYVTMMVASVSIGVGIDYSIHFVHGVTGGLRQGLSRAEAIGLAFREKGSAIAANSLAVMLGFAVLLLASMSPLRTFGGIMVGSMFLAAFSALTILPALLLKVKIK